jgi:hypothetical protein
MPDHGRTSRDIRLQDIELVGVARQEDGALLARLHIGVPDCGTACLLLQIKFLEGAIVDGHLAVAGGPAFPRDPPDSAADTPIYEWSDVCEPTCEFRI